MKKSIKGSKWFLILATVVCFILLIVSILVFMQDRSPFTMVTIIIVLGALVLNFVYFKQENK
ncbi:hypothetical protein [Paenilisteria rocourtiae]|uniref:hypothetical protein n=1 Tax=Listeria rocourtiae TaxID=647910 RepID=UPI0003E84B46|nr:hypothetical protein [Listeria rocourtiae]EUJ42632.1 hypothetical protein PROCOU_16819 [Listeria rocourtiae FSL F6-920]